MTFDEWLSEQENFTSRVERLYEDFPEVKDLGKLRRWLEAAYLVGKETGLKEERYFYEDGYYGEPWGY